MNNSIIINERQFSYLSEELKKNKSISESVVITDWLSPDERYVIFLDDLYDLKEKRNLGDIWENFDNFKLFLTHSFRQSSNVPRNIKESCLRSLKKMIITESNQDYTILKPLVKQLIKEGESFFDSAWEKTKEVGGDLLSGLKKAGSDLYQGSKNFGSAIMKGDYKEALKIIGRGVLYLARKIRSALHNPVGLILDTLLIITGIGKTIQWIPWAIIVALDIYELSTGDYEDKTQPQWIRILLTSCDVLGLVLSGLIATGAMKYMLRTAFKYATMSAFLRGIKDDKEGQSHLNTMGETYNNNSWLSKMGMAEDYVTEKNPKIGGFIGEQKQKASILPDLFNTEVQTPAAELRNSNYKDTKIGFDIGGSNKKEEPSLFNDIFKGLGII